MFDSEMMLEVSSSRLDTLLDTESVLSFTVPCDRRVLVNGNKWCSDAIELRRRIVERPLSVAESTC